MKILKFCPVDGFILDVKNRCPECEVHWGEGPDGAIQGAFFDEGADRMVQIQASGEGAPA